MPIQAKMPRSDLFDSGKSVFPPETIHGRCAKGIKLIWGSLKAGSNTVSNLMFSFFQFGVAERLTRPITLMVAMQAVGAAAGNMIAIHNVVAASSTVGYLRKEGLILRKTIIPTLYYVIVVGILGLVGMHYMGIADPF